MLRKSKHAIMAHNLIAKTSLLRWRIIIHESDFVSSQFRPGIEEINPCHDASPTSLFCLNRTQILAALRVVDGKISQWQVDMTQQSTRSGGEVHIQ